MQLTLHVKEKLHVLEEAVTPDVYKKENIIAFAQYTLPNQHVQFIEEAKPYLDSFKTSTSYIIAKQIHT